MPAYTTYALGESEISVSGGQELSGFTQGDGSHLVGETITLNSNSWEAVSIDESDDTSFDDSDNSQSLDGTQTFDGTSYAGGRRVEAEYELTVQDPDGNTFTVLGFNINEAGGSISYATVEGLAFVGGPGGFPPVGVPLTVISNGEGPSYAYDDLATPICFTPSTRILTPDGEVPVEELAVGKEVLTLDQGSQPVRWIGKRKLLANDLQTNPRWRPVRIRAGALGKGIPETDLIVSPQHRILVKSAIVQRMFNVQEVLIPAIKLVSLDGINIIETAQDVEYWHFLFDAHQVVWSNGAPTESLFTGPETLKSVSPSAHAEIMALFPELEKAQFRPGTARHFSARGKKIKQLVARHIKNNKPMCELSH